ncbi:MAG: site-2 protease family protein, partial [Nitrososphaeria archaeon]
MGKISAWGPLVNIIMALVILPLAMSGFYFLITAVYFNSFIALFNLLPIAILDGRKIFFWNKKVWGLLFLVSVMLFIISLIGFY